MLIRVRSNVGVWRVDGLDPSTAKVSDLLTGIATTRPGVVYLQPLALDPPCKQALDPTQLLSAQGLVHGAMVHCRVDPSTTADHTTPVATLEGGDASSQQAAATSEAATPSHFRRVIDKDGSIKLVPTSEAPPPGQDRGFRKGMLPLRDMKMSWTLSDFVAMDAQYEFKIKRQEEAICKQVSLDIPSVSNFQAYLQQFSFQQKRFGILYGRFVKEDDSDDDDKKTKCRVEAIYEPPQQVDPSTPEGFVPLDDDKEELVDEIAGLVGLVRVGWIFGHEPRAKELVMTAAEIIVAAEYQLEAAGGVDETTPFCTVVVAPGKDGTVSVEAFQVSQQCMAMVAEQALETGDNPAECAINETFTAIQEGKASKTVNTNFFLTVVPIAQHTSDLFVADFPRANRDLDDRKATPEELKRHMQKSGTMGWTFVDRLADLNLLIYLSQFLDLKADMPKVCASISNKDLPLDDGYKLLIKSMAGLEGSY